MSKIYSAVFATALTAIIFGFSGSTVQAERQVQLINFATTPWRYNTNGMDQGTAWRSRTFADASWPSGMGLLAYETGTTYPYPFNTIFDSSVTNVITCYFRAHFNMAASDLIFPLTLVMSNLVDDGCLVYLNSNFVAAIRLPQNAGYLTVATGGPGTEGMYETPVYINNATNFLLVGDNVIAVEVHQSSAVSSDIVQGLSLTAIVPTTLSITSQPPSQVAATIGSQFTLTAGISGGPGLYQWQRDNGAGTFVNIAGANGMVGTGGVFTTTFSSTPLAISTSIYRLVVSNGVNTVISSTSTVTVAADTSGPYMLAANVMEEATRTNRIQITWNERLLGGQSGPVCAGCGTNFTVVLAATGVPVTVSNVLYNPSGGPPPDLAPITILQMSTTNWFIGSNYYIIVNRVRDEQRNVIAPNSVIGVGWPISVNTNVMVYGGGWEYHNDWGNPFNPDPTIYQQAWYALDYNTVTNGHWGSGCGVMYKDPFVTQVVLCRGELNPTCGELGSWVQNPTLFRASFVVPPSLGTNVTLRISELVDDGYVMYLNGVELRRVNVPAGPVNENLRSSSQYADGQCASNNMSVVLRPGTNVIAAAVCQDAVDDGLNGGDIFWALRLDVTQISYRISPVPANGVSPVRLGYSHPSFRNVMFTWPTNIYGYALEYTTNITRVGQNTVLGPWYQAQTNMAIGMVTNYPLPATVGPGPAYIFRLHKVP